MCGIALTELRKEKICYFMIFKLSSVIPMDMHVLHGRANWMNLSKTQVTILLFELSERMIIFA